MPIRAIVATLILSCVFLQACSDAPSSQYQAQGTSTEIPQPKVAANNPDDLHYVNSQAASNKAVNVLIRSGVGDISRLSSEDKAQMLGFLEVAIKEAAQVSDAYLKNVHPEFPQKYKDYKFSIDLMAKGLKGNSFTKSAAGVYGFNEFSIWMEKHNRELTFP